MITNDKPKTRAEIAKEEGNLHNYYGSPAFWLVVIAIVTICIVLEFADY